MKEGRRPMPNQPSQFDNALKYALAEVKRFGDPANLAPPIQTVVLVHTAQGIIDNGGLQYFFESDFPRKPPYSIFVDAYRAIGANEEADALADAVKLFPFPDPHRFQDQREKFMDPFLDCDPQDNPFEPFTNKLCGNKNVWRLLEEYVQYHAASFPIWQGAMPGGGAPGHAHPTSLLNFPLTPHQLPKDNPKQHRWLGDVLLLGPRE